MFTFCPRCGHIQKKNKETACPACEYELRNVPVQYLSEQGNWFKSQDARNEFIENVIKTSEVYNAELAGNREDILAKKQKLHKILIDEKVKEYNESKFTLKCPVCGNSSVSKVPKVSKIAKFTAFKCLGGAEYGVGALEKKWHCNICGYNF